jgi:hypothetical protein
VTSGDWLFDLAVGVWVFAAVLWIPIGAALLLG